jgi:thymidylate synthase (FAD)
VEVNYLDHLGNDLTAANAARVSMGRKSEFDVVPAVPGGYLCEDTNTLRTYCERQANHRTDMFQEATDVPVDEPGCQCGYQLAEPERLVLKEKDARLLGFLAREKHEIPFAHPHVQFHFKAPIFVARQLAKHQVGMVWSEISRRYVSGEPEFFWPAVWRKGSADIKQGSLDEGVEEEAAETMAAWRKGTEIHATNAYTTAQRMGVAPELARMFLPQNVYTEWHWTGSLLAWARVWKLRVDPHAQAETREIVKLIEPTMLRLFPVSWACLTQTGVETTPQT